MARLTVRPYTFQTLTKLLQSCSEASDAYVNQKLQSNYFRNYFQAVKAKTIVVEHDYTDRDFLEDYAAYFVRCFRTYRKTCTRLHFFSSRFTGKELKSHLSSRDGRLTPQKLQESYLGFTVVKRLPQTFLGRTCLVTYPSDGGRRFYVVRPYDVSLYGLNLTVESLAFQEQDTVAGACATSALWSVFQGTGEIFHHHIPSPVEVSNYADRAHASEARKSPSRGLTDEQAFEAIKQLGLEPNDVIATDIKSLARTSYAYLRGNVPIYLGAGIYKNPAGTGDIPESKLEFESSHAMALVGFSLGLPGVAQDENRVSLLAYRMDKIYVHDDQVGPFARADLADRNLILKEGGAMSLFTLQTSRPPDQLVVPDKMIIPLYHKVRIPFSTAYSSISGFDRALKATLAHAGVGSSDLMWDIYLTTTNREKRAILDNQLITNDRRLELVTTPMPRFLWKAQLLERDTPILTLLLDATDIEQGQMVTAVWQEGKHLLHRMIRLIAVNPAIKQNYQLHSQWRIWEAMSNLH